MIRRILSLFLACVVGALYGAFVALCIYCGTQVGLALRARFIEKPPEITSMADVEVLDADDKALLELWETCKSDPGRFNTAVLGRPPYWWRQEQICRSVVTYNTTLAPAGNMVGKSFVDAGLLHWFLYSHPNCMVLCTAPSHVQLEEVLWMQVEAAWRGSRIPLGGRLLRDPLKIDLGGGWHALAYSTTKVERLSGHHRGYLLAIIDEASGVLDPIYEAIDSCDPSRYLLTGNPLWPYGQFYERCTRAENGGNPLAHLIRISSLESPDIDLERSPRGMANATWLAKARNDYGEGSIWWKSHVLALFPDSAADTVVPRSWIDLAAKTVHVRRGPVRLAIDLGLGNGGDRSVLAAGDDNGLVALKWSPTWSLEATATQAKLVCQRWGIEPHDVSYDVEGIGADFSNRLEAVGIVGARPYRGGGEGGKKYGNRRSSAAWSLRQRLDPARQVRTEGGVMIPQTPYAIKAEHATALREELQGLRYSLDIQGRILLEKKEDFVLRLRRSPDLADAVCQLHYRNVA